MPAAAPPGSEHDQLAITGRATLDGLLLVSLLEGYTPGEGDTFRVLTFGSRVGDFAYMLLPEEMSAGYNAAGLTLMA